MVHIHVVLADDPQWGNYLDFRDHLRASADLRARYAALKLEPLLCVATEWRSNRAALEQRMDIRPFQAGDEPFIVDLWDQCGLLRSWNDPYKDIRRKASIQSELFLVGVIEGALVATVMAGYDGHRGWVNYLAVSPKHRRKGFGRSLMSAAEQGLRRLGCPKVNLQVRHGNVEAIQFYQRLGYLEDAVVSFGKRLERDD